MRLYNSDQIEMPVPLEDVLIDGHVPQESETPLMITHHNGVGFAVAPRQVRPLDRSPGRRSADDTSAIE